MKFRILLLILLSFSTTNVYAADFSLRVRHREGSRRIILNSSPIVGTDCRLRVYAGSKRGNLSRRGTLIAASDISDGSKTFRLNRIPRRASSSKRFYFQGIASCDEGDRLSRVVAKSVAGTSRGVRSDNRWLRSLLQKSLPAFNLTQVYSTVSIDSLVAVEQAGDGSNRLYAVSQCGTIQVFDGSLEAPTATTFLDISDKTNCIGERGLFAIAFHPDFSTNGRFFVHYTRSSDGATILSEFALDGGDPTDADETSEQILLTVAQPYSNHNGGQILFGSDGLLYMSLGDGGSAGDPENRAQDRTTLLGKLLRIDVDTTTGSLDYGIPSTNPYVGNTDGYREEIYAYGLRNGWRFSFDDEDRLWLADVGQNRFEEINLIEAGGNYGWRLREGNRCYNPATNCGNDGLTSPIFVYSHGKGSSVTGGHIVEASLDIKGWYLFGDFIAGKIWVLDYDGRSSRSAQLFDTASFYSSFSIIQDGSSLVAAYDGSIYRIEARS